MDLSDIWVVESYPITEWLVILMTFEYLSKFSPVFRPPFEYRTSIQMVVWILNYHLPDIWIHVFSVNLVGKEELNLLQKVSDF